MNTMKLAMVYAVLMTVALVALNGLGCHMLGLRHSGAHVIVEAASAFLVTLVAAVAVLASRQGRGGAVGSYREPAQLRGEERAVEDESASRARVSR